MTKQFFSWEDAARTGWGKKDHDPLDKLPFRMDEVGVGALQRIARALEEIETRLGQVALLLDPEERQRQRETAEWLAYHRRVYYPFVKTVRQRLKAALPPRPGERGDPDCLRRVAPDLAWSIKASLGVKFPEAAALLAALDALGDLATADLSFVKLSARTAKRLAAIRAARAARNGRHNLLTPE